MADVLTADTRALRYTNTAVAIHWISAALILAQIWLGFTFGDYPKGSPERSMLFDWHKTVGVTILLLALLRLLVRAKNPPPPFTDDVSPVHRRFATWTHRLLYAFMIVMPATGLMLVSKGGATTGLVGGLAFPTIPNVAGLGGLHEPIAFGMIALLVLHLAAALRNQFLDGGPIASRMPPFKGRAA